MKHLIFILLFISAVVSCSNSSNENDEASGNDENSTDIETNDNDLKFDFSTKSFETGEKTVRDIIACDGMIVVSGESDGTAFVASYENNELKWKFFINENSAQSVNALACGSTETSDPFVIVAGDVSTGTNSPQIGFFKVLERNTGSATSEFEINSGKAVSIYAVTTDKEMNVYIGGRIEGTFEGSDEYGGKDGFVAKYHHQDGFKFFTQFGTPSFDSVQGITIGSDGYILAAGYSQGNIETGDNINDSEGMKGFVIKLKPEGDIHWKKMYDSINFWKIAAPVPYSFFVTGSIKKGDKTAAVAYQIGLDGKIKAIYNFASTGNSVATGIDSDSQRNIYVTGYIEGNFLSGQKIPPVENDLPAGNNIFLGVFNTTTSNRLYSTVFGSEDHDISPRISVLSDTSIYTGYYSVKNLTDSSGVATITQFEKKE